MKKALDLLYPCSKTALLQHLQHLVLRGNPWWIGGVIHPSKFAALVKKMEARFPLLRNEAGRTYDRKCGRATAHMVAYPTETGVAWWVLTSDGLGGLSDENNPDYKAAKHAMARDSHICFEDYVLLYAHKKDARTIYDVKGNKEIQLLKDCSTWTWRLTSEAYSRILDNIQDEVSRLNYGDDSFKFFGLKGVLYYQRQRPQFSGVRTQVIELHREAIKRWGRVKKQWLTQHPQLVAKYGDRAGELRPIGEITSKHLPKMTTRLKVYSDEKKTFMSLCEDSSQ